MTSIEDEPNAVITGASSGIGRSYALRLAELGYAPLLVGRDRDRLEAVRQEVARHGVSATSLVADLSQPEGLATVAARIEALPRVEFLVNNAGFGTMGDFADVELAMHLEMVQVHCSATVGLTHAALQRMRTCGRGNIVNVSSMSAFLIAPGQATYAATKAMLVSFSESLQGEWEHTGIRIQVLCPGFTQTGFHDRPAFAQFNREQIASHLWMSPEQVVSASLDGLKTKRVVCVPGFKNRMISRALTLRPIRKLAGKKVRKR